MTCGGAKRWTKAIQCLASRLKKIKNSKTKKTKRNWTLNKLKQRAQFRIIDLGFRVLYICMYVYTCIQIYLYLYIEQISWRKTMKETRNMKRYDAMSGWWWCCLCADFLLRLIATTWGLKQSGRLLPLSVGNWKLNKLP